MNDIKHDRRISGDFSASNGRRELDIFLLSDHARREFRKMEDAERQEIEKLRQQQADRREADIAAARIEVGQDKPLPEPAPPGFASKKKTKSARTTDSRAEELVDSRNDKAVRDTQFEHRRQQDDFLARQTEARLLKGASGYYSEKTPRGPPDLRRDFEWGR